MARSHCPPASSEPGSSRAIAETAGGDHVQPAARGVPPRSIRYAVELPDRREVLADTEAGVPVDPTYHRDHAVDLLLGDAVVRVFSDDRSLLDDVTRPLAGLAVPATGTEPVDDLTVLRHPKGHWELYWTPTSRVAASSWAVLVEILIAFLNRWTVDANPHRVHLHAGGLVHPKGEVLVVIGPSGSGKSTLARAADGLGWSYLSDEIVAVTRNGSSTFGYPKAITQKPGSEDVIPPDSSEIGAGVRIAAPRNPLRVVDRPPSVVARVSYDPSGPWLLRSHPADAIGWMAEHNFDLIRAGSWGMEALVRVAVGAAAVEIRFPDPHQGVAMLESVLPDGPHRWPWSRLTPINPPSGTGWSPSVEAWAVAGRVVAFDGRHVMQLPTTRWWTAPRDAATSSEAGEALLDSLIGLGMIRR